jgi:ribosomal 30S subunit maturation factor RimM
MSDFLSRYRKVAAVIRAKGLDGSLVVEPLVRVGDGGLRPGLEVRIVPPILRQPRSASVLSCERQGKRLLLRLSGYTGPDAGKLLAGHFLLACVDDLADEALSADVPDAMATALTGVETISDQVSGLEGKLLGVQDNPAHPLLEVALKGQAFLVPYVDDWIVSCEDGRLTMRLPKGLF